MLKKTQLEGISTKLVKKNSNTFATLFVKNIYTCIKRENFLINIKWLTKSDKIPAFEKGDKYDKSNYQLVSILPVLSEVYEKCLYKQIENYMKNVYPLIFNVVSGKVLMHKCLTDMTENDK